jgi:uncharacterized membrane protein YiaA
MNMENSTTLKSNNDRKRPMMVASWTAILFGMFLVMIGIYVGVHYDFGDSSERYDSSPVKSSESHYYVQAFTMIFITGIILFVIGILIRCIDERSG